MSDIFRPLTIFSQIFIGAKIMDRWDDWVSGQQLLGETDEFWGL